MIATTGSVAHYHSCLLLFLLFHVVKCVSCSLVHQQLYMDKTDFFFVVLLWPACFQPQGCVCWWTPEKSYTSPGETLTTRCMERPWWVLIHGPPWWSKEWWRLRCLTTICPAYVHCGTTVESRMLTIGGASSSWWGLMDMLSTLVCLHSLIVHKLPEGARKNTFACPSHTYIFSWRGII